MKKSNAVQATFAKKKTYHKPELSLFGTITQLTHAGGNGPLSDSGNNMMAS